MASLGQTQPPSDRAEGSGGKPFSTGPDAVVGDISIRARFGYATGSLVTGSFVTVPGLVLMPYLTDTLGVGAVVSGLLILAPKAWDIAMNPMAGRLSDRTHSRWGARRPYLLVAGLAVAVLFVLMFAGVFTGSAGAAWVCTCYLAAATAFAFFQVPYGAMSADMTERAGLRDPNGERTRMMVWRAAALALTILVAGGLAPHVVRSFGGGIAGHRAMGVFVALVVIVGAVCAFSFTRNAPTGVVISSEPTLRDQLMIAARNKPFRVLVSCVLAQAAGVATMLGGVQYFARQVLHDTDAVTIIVACAIGPALVVMPAWRWIGDRIGKMRGFVYASLVMSVGALALALAPTLPPFVSYAIVVLVGCGFAGQELFGLSMLPDCIAYGTIRSGKRQAGVFTGLWTAGETLGFALGPTCFGQTIQLFGFIPSTTGVAAPQTPLVDLGVLLGFTIVPAILFALAPIFMLAYDIPLGAVDADHDIRAR
jgi:glycoside/pentoside/hexuronide:cation symporter, GPH family